MNRKICIGDGECLKIIHGEYYRDKSFNCCYYCNPVKCPNYKECKKCVPQRELDCWDGHCVCCEVFLDKPSPNRSMDRPCTR